MSVQNDSFYLSTTENSTETKMKCHATLYRMALDAYTKWLKRDRNKDQAVDG